MKFNTIIYNLQSSRNIGMIVRSHVAFGGDLLIFVGYEKPFEFDEEAIAYSTNLYLKCEIMNFSSFLEFFNWSKNNGYVLYAIEIAEDAVSLPGHQFPDNVNFIVGNEFVGIPMDILINCNEVITIPQYGPAACLNVAVAAAITFYEFAKKFPQNIIKGAKFIE